jgi:hypothetical protein
MTRANLTVAEDLGRRDSVSTCQRMLGLLALTAEGKGGASARAHFNAAVEVAREISERTVLLIALTVRGRWEARWGNVADARADLEEAAQYAKAGQYRLLDVDLRVALAWLHARLGDGAAARLEIQYATKLSKQIDYAWGYEDATVVARSLNAIETL